MHHFHERFLLEKKKEKVDFNQSDQSILLFMCALDEQIVLIRKHNFVCKRGLGDDNA